MVNDVVSNTVMKQAMDILLSKKDTAGYDRMHVHDLPSYIANNKEEWRSSILQGTYHPGNVQQYEIVGRNGKKRLVTTVNSIDKFTSECFYICLEPVIENVLQDGSFAFRKGRGLLDAVKKCREYVNEDRKGFVLKLDIEDYFGHIDHEILKKQLFPVVRDRKAVTLIQRLVECDVIFEHELVPWENGIIQGSVLSPCLSNLYLNSFDLYLQSLQIPYVRYGDDVMLFLHTYEESIKTLMLMKEWLNNNLKLSLNMEKSSVFPVMDARYFNYTFQEDDNGSLVLKKHIRSAFTYYREWMPSALSISEGHFHIMENGILSRKDMSLLFENEELIQHYPVEMTSDINVYSDMVYSSSFFRMANDKRFIVNMFDDKGIFIGSFIPDSSNPDASMLLKQAQAYLDNDLHLQYAKKFEYASIYNMYAVIRYYNQRRNNLLQSKCDQIRHQSEMIKKSDSLNEMMLIEARARELYYSCFSSIMESSDFTFHGRNRRPPKDPVNAMISFGNTFLYNRISSMICRTKLDNRLSFVHSPKTRKTNLCLDLADIYKPLIVDRTIFSIINKHMMNTEVHFSYNETDGSVLLNEGGCRILIQQLERKLSSHISKNGKEWSYLQIIRYDIQQLVHSLNSSSCAFQPYTGVH